MCPETGEGSWASRWRAMMASTILLSMEFEAPKAVKSQSKAWSVVESMGRMRLKAW